jgi:hypothetical protein
VFGSNTGALAAPVGGGAIAAPGTAQAHHGLIGGFDAHLTGSQLRQTISVFCSPGDRTRLAMQFFGPQILHTSSTEM